MKYYTDAVDNKPDIIVFNLELEKLKNKEVSQLMYEVVSVHEPILINA